MKMRRSAALMLALLLLMSACGPKAQSSGTVNRMPETAAETKAEETSPEVKAEETAPEVKAEESPAAAEKEETAAETKVEGSAAEEETTAEETAAETEAETEAAETEAKTEVAETAAETESEAAETAAEETAPEETSAEASAQAGDENIFAQMEGIVFGFMSGVGAWETMLEVAPDGSFSGQFYDMNMGETGEGYSNGTLYECAFTGSFETPERVDDVTWKTKVASLDYETEIDGSDHYIDEEHMLHILTSPYGLSLGDTVEIYSADKEVSGLGDEFMSWLFWRIPEDAETLGGIALYNTDGQYVFYPDYYAMEEPEEPEQPGGPEPEYGPAPLPPYESVTAQNLQGTWLNMYEEAGATVEEYLTLDGLHGTIESYRDGVREGVWNGEGTVSIEDRGERNLCPRLSIDEEDGSNLCTIYIRWVKEDRFFDGLFLNEWVRVG